MKPSKIFRFFLSLLLIVLFSCNGDQSKNEVISEKTEISEVPTTPFLVVLGTVQDAGSPHIGCKKSCCKDLFVHPDPNRQVVSLGLVDPDSNKTVLFEATPDMATQLKALKTIAPFEASEVPNMIFLTHAHIGHYSGLMYLGKEALGANKARVYTMPRMRSFLENNGPWDQLVSQENIELHDLSDRNEVTVEGSLSIAPFTVPHRDEYSETVGYFIESNTKKAVFIPDIDKWEKWELSIVEAIADVDYAFLDATFFDAAEVNHRDISEIPHPFVIESMELFKELPDSEKKKIYFIHFNHTNPLLDPSSLQYQEVIAKGFNVANIGDIIPM